MNHPLLIKTVLAALAIGIAQQASAITIYKVSSTSTINCGDDPHGLWTNTYTSSSCNEYYDFQNGSTLTVDKANGTASLDATAKNDLDNLATIKIEFGGFFETYPYYKNGGTPNYNGTDTPTDWDFFSYITSGSISFSNGDIFQTLLVDQPSLGVASSDKPVLQIGNGANDKSSGFGASAWLDVYDTASNREYTDGNHWDLNMNLTSVPAPAPLVLFGIGILGMFSTPRRHRK